MQQLRCLGLRFSLNILRGLLDMILFSNSLRMQKDLMSGTEQNWLRFFSSLLKLLNILYRAATQILGSQESSQEIAQSLFSEDFEIRAQLCMTFFLFYVSRFKLATPFISIQHCLWYLVMQLMSKISLVRRLIRPSKQQTIHRGLRQYSHHCELWHWSGSLLLTYCRV